MRLREARVDLAPPGGDEMFLLRNYGGTLVNIEKVDCIYKIEKNAGDHIVYRIETENQSDGSGFILGEYKTREERDKAYENMMTFLNAMDIKQFEE